MKKKLIQKFIDDSKQEFSTQRPVSTDLQSWELNFAGTPLCHISYVLWMWAFLRLRINAKSQKFHD